MTKNITILGGKHNCQNICSIQVYKSPCHIQTWDLCVSSLIHVNVYPPAMKLDKHMLIYYNFRTLSSKNTCIFSSEAFLKRTLVLGQATEVECFG